MVKKETRILIFGAGPLGSLLAARLHQGGRKVTLLARGQRLADLRDHGVVLKSWTSGQEEVVHLPLVEKLEPDDAYDLIIVVMRKNSALKILPILAANPHGRVLFLMNNAAGPEALVRALGVERVLIGFAGAAGYREGHKIVYINAEENQPAGIYLGESGGGITPRLQEVASLLAGGKYIEPTIPYKHTWTSGLNITLRCFSLRWPRRFICAATIITAWRAPVTHWCWLCGAYVKAFRY